MPELTTFLFLDLVGSVDLKRQMPGGSDTERDAAYVETILTPHRSRIETLLPGSGGRVVSTAGDSHFLVFSDTIRAARWALALKENHHTAPITTPTGGAIALRMSLHVGVPQVDPSDPNNFVGKAVDYAARLNDLAAADQIIVSRAVLAILEDAGLDGVRFAPQGDADLKGIGRTPIFELLTTSAKPKSIRRTPREQSLVDARWRVVPPTVSLSQFDGGGGGSSRAATAVGGLKRIGNYELVRLVGAGGMGNVYEAKHQQFGRRRAVKVIKPLLVDSGAQDVVRRFYREIKAIGALEHPNVVVAIDSSAPTDPVHYLVMEFLDGISADDLVLRNGPLRVADACEIIRQAAVGLEYIHKQGLVHRDVKPSNLMLTLVEAPSSADASASTTLAINPVVKILDLGLALLVGDDQSRLTQFDHGAMGTGMYMAPEQWKSASVDIRADIYSLGCSLYHLLAGRPPFFESDLRPEKAHEKEPPPPLRGRTDMPLELEQILTRMMAKSAADRFARPAEVAAALAPFTAGHALADLALRHTPTSASSPTHAGAGSDTLIGSSDPHETISAPPVPRPLWTPASQAPAPARRWLAYVLPMIALAGIAAAIGLGTLVQQQHSKLLSSHEKHLEFIANSAAEALESEIAQRLRLLTDVADNGNLRPALELVAQQPDDRSRWEQVQRLIEKKKVENDESLPAESWFVTDAQGVQIARAPESKESIGKSFADRDYFHGQGITPPKEPAPIRMPHRSVVYRSTSSRKLKVAFSAPIFSADRTQVLGVVGMSLNLGDFAELENRKDLEEAEVLLVDLRADDQPGGAAGGLILHAPELEQFDRPDAPPRLPQELADKIKATLANQNPGAPGRNRLLDGYADIFDRNDGQSYWAAFQPVQSAEDPGEPQWMVLVQEVKP